MAVASGDGAVHVSRSRLELRDSCEELEDDYNLRPCGAARHSSGRHDADEEADDLHRWVPLSSSQHLYSSWPCAAGSTDIMGPRHEICVGSGSDPHRIQTYTWAQPDLPRQRWSVPPPPYQEEWAWGPFRSSMRPPEPMTVSIKDASGSIPGDDQCVSERYSCMLCADSSDAAPRTAAAPRAAALPAVLDMEPVCIDKAETAVYVSVVGASRTPLKKTADKESADCGAPPHEAAEDAATCCAPLPAGVSGSDSSGTRSDREISFTNRQWQIYGDPIYAMIKQPLR